MPLNAPALNDCHFELSIFKHKRKHEMNAKKKAHIAQSGVVVTAIVAGSALGSIRAERIDDSVVLTADVADSTQELVPGVNMTPDTSAAKMVAVTVGVGLAPIAKSAVFPHFVAEEIDSYGKGLPEFDEEAFDY